MKNNILRKWRLENGVSQKELAERLDVSQALISHYERMGLPNSVSMLRGISKVTSIPFDDLVSAI